MPKGNVKNLLEVPNVEAFIKEHLIINKELFLGIHDESITVYYWCKAMLELTYFADNKCTIKIAKKYIDHTALCGLKFIEKSDFMFFAFSDAFIKAFSDSYEILKNNIEKLTDESHASDEQTGSLAKKYQGIIACNNNANESSDWYCVDLDYCPEDTPFGRLDMVGISKDPQNNKHRLVLIKLMYSWQAYKSGYRKNLYNNKKNKGYYIQGKDLKTRKNAAGDTHPKRFGCKFDEKKKTVIAYEFGSGITGDFYNYSRFLLNDDGKHVDQLKEECYDILRAKKELGCFETNDRLGDDLLKLLEGTKEAFVAQLDDSAECIFLTVGCDSLEKCKESLSSYLRPGPTNTADILSITRDTWNGYHNNGKGVLKHVIHDLSLAEAFPAEFDEKVRYVFTTNEALENLNIIDHPDSSSDDELVLKIFS